MSARTLRRIFRMKQTACDDAGTQVRLLPIPNQNKRRPVVKRTNPLQQVLLPRQMLFWLRLPCLLEFDLETVSLLTPTNSTKLASENNDDADRSVPCHSFAADETIRVSHDSPGSIFACEPVAAGNASSVVNRSFSKNRRSDESHSSTRSKYVDRAATALPG